jgi:hypothetical protein
MSGVVRSGARARRSSLVVSPYGLPSTRDANEAASWAAGWVRDVVGPQTAVHVLMPDAFRRVADHLGRQRVSAGGTRT